MNTVCYKPMFVLSPGGGLLNNLYIRAVWLNIYLFSTHLPKREALLKTCSFMEQTQIKRVAAAVVESL